MNKREREAIILTIKQVLKHDDSRRAMFVCDLGAEFKKLDTAFDMEAWHRDCRVNEQDYYRHIEVRR